MKKREVMLSLLDSNIQTAYIPAGFFIHFDESCHRGQAAINKHLAYFNETGMDFVKIQYEKRFPFNPGITRPADWVKLPNYGLDFFADQVDIAKGLVKAAGRDALVLMTLYSPFMCAGQCIGKDLLAEHLRENPDQTSKGIEIITESLKTFVKECIAIGVDGFYHSTQGGETHRFERSSIFTEYIKPFDLTLMEEIERECEFNILHICDYEGGYRDLTPFLDYPGHVVNANLTLGDKTISICDLYDLFGRPIMGGMNRHGIITTGSQDEIKDAVKLVCGNAPNQFILGADCTLPGDTDWNNIKTAINTAHQFTK